MRRIGLILLTLLPLCSCKAVSNFIHDDEVVARVGTDKLYLSELRQVIPQDVSPEDSANIAGQYISAWATELLYLKVADGQLTREAKDVSHELEAYRRSLLKYRYEQQYVGDRLDTLVTDAQIEDYYNSHLDRFLLRRPVLKFRYSVIPKGSRQREEIVKKMSSLDSDAVFVLDSLVRTQTIKYIDSVDEWMDVVVLTDEYGLDYTSLLSKLSDSYIKVTDDDGNLKVAYVFEVKRSGTAPMDYCRERIRDIILSARKHELLSSLERDLLKDALDKKQFVIY